MRVNLLTFVTTFHFSISIHCTCETYLQTSRIKRRCPKWTFQSVVFTFKLGVEKWNLFSAAKNFLRMCILQRILRQINCSMIPHFSHLKIINRKRIKFLENPIIAERNYSHLSLYAFSVLGYHVESSYT